MQSLPLEDPLAGELRTLLRQESRVFALTVGTLVRLHAESPPAQREFVHGEVAGLLHLAPVTAGNRLGQALAVHDLPDLHCALERGRLPVVAALALLSEVEHLELELRRAVVAEVLGEEEDHVDDHGIDARTPGELRAAARKAALRLDAEAAARRREAARQRAGARLSRDVDGMAALVVTGEAGEVAQACAALRARAAALPPTPELTQGQREVQALLVALGVPTSVQVQAVVECPVVRPALVDVRMSAATALGLSDEPAELTGYGPIDADAARALLPAADLVRACVDGVTGEVLAVDPPLRARRGERAAPRSASELRRTLVGLATTPVLPQHDEVDGYRPSEALGRLVDLRDVTSVFPGDATPARQTERDHRVPAPEGPTSALNLQNLSKRWHRAKHEGGWDCWLFPDGTLFWVSPRGNGYTRLPRRNAPPRLDPQRRLPPLPDD